MVKSVEGYSEKILSMKFKIKNRLKKCHAIVKSDDNKECSNETSKNETKNISEVKLPKFSIEKISGDCSQFIEFFYCFANSIDNYENSIKIENFQYLKSLLSGPG